MTWWRWAIGVAVVGGLLGAGDVRAQDGDGATAGFGEARTVDLVYSGGSGGLGLERYTFGVHRRLARVAEEAGLSLSVERVLHGVFHQGPSAVWGAGETVAATLAFLEAGTPTCEVAREGLALRTPTEWVLLPEGATEVLADAPDVRQAAVTWRRCRAGDAEAFWVGPADAPEPEWDVEAFDVRLALRFAARDDARDLPVYVLGMPRQEAGRRARALLDLLSSRSDAAFVDAGDFVPGASSIRSGEVSLHRGTGLALLERLHPAALAPSATELAPGPRAFLEEAAERGLTYVATNWRAEDPALALPAVVRRSLGPPDDPVDVAFLGVVDPAVAQQVVAVGKEGVTLLDPVTAVQAEVDALATSEDPPDVVVLLALASPTLQAELRQRLYGVDLHIGDRYAATLRVERETVVTRPTSRLDKASPITLPMDGILVARLEVGPERLERVTVETVPVTAADPTYEPVTAAVTRVRAQVYAGRDEVLVPLISDDPLGSVDAETLAALTCRAVLEATGADAVFLPPLRPGIQAPGPLTTLQVADRLAVLDILEEHRVDGDRMYDFLLQALGEVDTTCGADVGSRLPKVRGQSVYSGRTYRIVTTDRARLTTGLGALLAGASAGLVLQLPTYDALTDEEGAPLRLSAVVLRQLLTWREGAGDGAWATEVLARSPATKEPLWLFDAQRLSLRVGSFRRSDRPDAYEQVPETKLNSPNSFTLGGDADVGLVAFGPKVTWDLRFLSAYTLLQVQGETSQETADDWRLSSSFTLPFAAFPVAGNPRFAPYGEVLFDSEYTPLVDSEGVTQPQQADLSLTLGLSALQWKWLRKLRLGGFVNRDMARLDEKTFEFGGKLEAETRHDLLRASSVRIETRWEALVFGDTPDDDAADLRLRAFGEVRLLLRLIRWLDVALYAQGLVAQGRVPETRQVAASTTLGAALDLAAAFRLSHYGARR